MRNVNVNLQQNSQLRETAVSISVLWVWLSRNITINTFKFHFVFYSGFHITQTFVTINLQHFILLHFFCYNFYPQTFHAILFNFQDSSATFQRENFHFCFHKTWQIGVKFNQKVVVWKALNANVSLTDAVADLATEISPLPQTKIGKKSQQVTEN